MVLVNISAYFLPRPRRAKLANVQQTYVSGTVVSTLAGVISFKPPDQVGCVMIPILERGTPAREVG